MSFFCVWPMIVVSALLFVMGVLGLIRGRFRGKYDWAAMQQAWVRGWWGRLLSLLVMIPFLLGLTNAVVDVIAMTNDQDGWKAGSISLAFAHGGSLVFTCLMALLIYLIAPKSYDS